MSINPAKNLGRYTPAYKGAGKCSDLFIGRALLDCIIAPEDLSEYDTEFNVFVQFADQLKRNITAAGPNYPRCPISDAEIATEHYLPRLVMFYSGYERGSLAIIPDIKRIIPQSDQIRATFYQKILNSIAYSLQHPQHLTNKRPEKALSLFVDSWRQSQYHFRNTFCQQPSTYCIVEALETDTIPTFYGNSASRSKAPPEPTDPERVIERIARRAFGHTEGRGRVLPSLVPGRSDDQCAEFMAWGYITGFVNEFLGSNSQRTLVITSLTMNREKTEVGFCDNCKRRASTWIERYPGLTIIDLGDKPPRVFSAAPQSQSVPVAGLLQRFWRQVTGSQWG